jgi:rRNA maturation RNase YbeY
MIQIVTSSRYKINRRRIRKHLEGLFLKNELPEEIEVNCVFIGKNKMRDIAETYKKEDVALPVLSFSYRNNPAHSGNLLGEIFLCYPQIVLLAAERNKRVEDMIDAMITHGFDNLLK